MKHFKVVNTDNFGGDYPDERALCWADSEGGNPRVVLLSEAQAQAITDVLNGPDNQALYSPRYHKVVSSDYVLEGGFEP